MSRNRKSACVGCSGYRLSAFKRGVAYFYDRLKTAPPTRILYHMKSLDQAISEFMSARRFAVAGASDDPGKYGHKCFAALLKHGYTAVPLNPRAQTVMGLPAYPNLAMLPEPVQSLSV